MWQRFSERACKSVFFAQKEAVSAGDSYVSTEHLLLGLLRVSDSTAVQAIETLGVSVKLLRSEVKKHMPRSSDTTNADMKLAPRAKRVIDFAYDEARRLGNNFIGTEHLFLGLIAEEDGLTARVLAKSGVELESARRAVWELLKESGVVFGD